MEWTNKMVLEFLELYEKEHALWNPKHPDHKKRNKVTDAWKNIQHSFSVQCSIQDLKKKKEILKTIFRSLVCRINASMKGDANDIYKPSWFAYEKMASFLLTIYSPNSEITSSNKTGAINVDDNDDAVLNQSTKDSLNAMTKDSDPDAMGPKAKKRKTMSIKSIENHIIEAANVLKKVSNKPQKDKCSLFADLLAYKLRALDACSREVVMNQIDNLVFEATFKKICTHPVASFQSPSLRTNSESGNLQHELIQHDQHELIQHHQPELIQQDQPRLIQDDQPELITGINYSPTHSYSSHSVPSMSPTASLHSITILDDSDTILEDSSMQLHYKHEEESDFEEKLFVID